MKSVKSLPILICSIILLIFLTESPVIIHGKTKEPGWPRWRGPNGDGISNETDWNPEAPAEGPKILWKADVGFGNSNIVIQDKYLYVIGGSFREGDTVFCLNVETGKEVWRYSYPCGFGGGYGAQTTPAV